MKKIKTDCKAHEKKEMGKKEMMEEKLVKRYSRMKKK